MTPIEQAREAAQSYLDDPRHTDPRTSIRTRQIMDEAFERTILAAYRRCAEIAEALRDTTGYLSERERQYCAEHGDEIAAEIHKEAGI